MNAEDEFGEKILRRIPQEIIIFSLVIAIGALVLFDAVTSLFVLLGGILAALGFIWLKHSVSQLLLSGTRQALRSILLIYSLRLILIIAIFFIIILFFSEKIFALVAGFSTLILVFLIEAASALFKLKQWKN